MKLKTNTQLLLGDWVEGSVGKVNQRQNEKPLGETEGSAEDLKRFMFRNLGNVGSVSGIYCFIHRETSRCYVGSSVNIKDRVRYHLWMSKKSDRFFYKSLRRYGTPAFDFEIIEKCPKEGLLDREKFWISFYNSASIDGFNTHSNPYATYDFKHNKATIERMSAAKMGKKKTLETRNRMSAFQKFRAKNLTEEERKVLSDRFKQLRKTFIGYKHSPETRAKIALKSAGNKNFLGRKHSVETISKMKVAALKKTYSHLKGVNHYAARLTKSDVEHIRLNYVFKHRGSAKLLAERFNVSVVTIRGIVYGIKWKSISIVKSGRMN